MRFQKAIDLWSLSENQRKELKRGQWVYAGHPKDKGIWCGIRSSGSGVVAWYDNAKNRNNFWDYVKTLHEYAKG